MLKETNVVMLPTNEKAFNLTPIVMFRDKIFGCFSGDYLHDNAVFQHLYITSDEEIKEGDWYIDDTNNVRQSVTSDAVYWSLRKDYKKIIATTDKPLGLPSPSDGFIKKFIERYNAGTPITKVMVEYEEYPITTYGMSYGESETDTRLKVDKDNCITIRPVKESWTREELPIEAMKEYNELLFDAMCHAASGILANPQFSSFSYTDVAKSAIVAGKEIVKQYQAEVKKDDYVTDDGMWLGIGDKFYQVVFQFGELNIVEKTLDEGTYPFALMKTPRGIVYSDSVPFVEAIYGNKETAEQKIASDSTKNDSK